MPDIRTLFTRYKKYLFYLLAVLVLGWGFTPYQTIFAGLILGTSISFLNLWILYRKTVRLSEAIVQGKSVYSIGSLSRLAYSALAILIAIKFPNYFDTLATIIGLLASIGVMVLDYLLKFITKRKQEER